MSFAGGNFNTSDVRTMHELVVISLIKNNGRGGAENVPSGRGVAIGQHPMSKEGLINASSEMGPGT